MSVAECHNIVDVYFENETIACQGLCEPFVVNIP